VQGAECSLIINDRHLTEHVIASIFILLLVFMVSVAVVFTFEVILC